MPSDLVTLSHHLAEAQSARSQTSGDLSGLMNDLAEVFKGISHEVSRAALAGILGMTERKNVHGETVARLDDYAHQRLVEALNRSGHVCVIASEESVEAIPVPADCPKGKYALCFDPLDGSSNIDIGVSIGTIFSICEKKTPGEVGTVEDCLRKGTEQVAAGYALYGSSTMLVYTAGNGVHGFTLDPETGEFILTNPDIKTPAQGKLYSINEGNAARFDDGTRKYIEYIKTVDEKTGRPYSTRYIGSLVADFHRNLLKGGIFIYPAVPKPKLRLLYEAAPLAFVIEQAGGKASTGCERILDIQPTSLHQTVPLVIGSREDVELYEKYIAENAS